MCLWVSWSSLFASGLGMKGPEGLVREERADAGWPVGTWSSRITLPSQDGFGPILTHTLVQSLACFSSSPPTLSNSHFVDRLCVLVCGLCCGNSLKLICCSFRNIPTNYCRCNTQMTRNSYTQSYRFWALSWVICRCFTATISHQPKTIYVHSSLFFSPCGGPLWYLFCFN